jgi:hypothetical protein
MGRPQRKSVKEPFRGEKIVEQTLVIELFVRLFCFFPALSKRIIVKAEFYGAEMQYPAGSLSNQNNRSFVG